MKWKKMLMTWERKILRKVYGPTYENEHWRIKINSELESKYKSQDIVSVIKVRILEWLGLIIRMNETGTVEKISEEKLEGRRGRGRPRLRWIDGVEEDLMNMGIERWRIKGLDRAEWASVIKEAKAKLKGPQCYRKMKLNFEVMKFWHVFALHTDVKLWTQEESMKSYCDFKY
jgi:hypothetical protein